MLSVKSTEVTSSPSSEESQVSGMEIINNYESQNLSDGLERLKGSESEKRGITAEVLGEVKIPNMRGLNDRVVCQKMLDRLDTYHSMIENCINTTCKAIEVRKEVIKELNNARVFYDAQYRDVKVIANAYRMYENRLKNVRQKLAEKKLVLPSQSEARSCVSENTTCALPFTNTSSFDPDNASASGTSSKMLPGSIKKRLEQSPKPKFGKLAEVFTETKSDSEKQMSFESDLTGSSDLKYLSCQNIQNENITDLKITADHQNRVSKKINLNSAEKSSNQGTSILNRLIEKEEPENDDEIEFLLEKSYNMKKAKSNIDLKRKMEFPLQFKEKNICTDASGKAHSDSKQPSNTCVEGRKKSSGDIIVKEILN